MIERSTPVIVGVGQVNGASGAGEPVELIAAAVERAMADAGAAVPVDLIALSKIGTKQYANAPFELGLRTGFPDARTLQANHGGHTSQVVLCHAASEIAQGRTRAAIVAGGELGSAIRSGAHAGDAGRPMKRATDARERSAHPDAALGDDLYSWLCLPHEIELGVAEPIQSYPVMETALGAALGRSRDEHIAEISTLWAKFSEIASRNEFAHDRRVYSAKEIATPGPGNRYVGYPYTKLMNSNQFVDQAAAILLCSAGIAMDLGIPRDRWIFPHAGVIAHAPFVSERWNLHDIPVLEGAARYLEQLVDRPMREVELFDLYACFPFAVQAQANALGLDSATDVTLTGGMRFAGGPWNNYGTHMIANIVGRLREEPASMAVCSTNGGLATRFCIAAYSGQPSAHGFRTPAATLVDPTPRRRLEVRPTGTGRIEGYTVPHDRNNEPRHGLAACILEDGARAWARLEDADDVALMLADDPIGRTVHFAAPGPRLE